MKMMMMKFQQVPNTLSIDNQSDSSKFNVDISNITGGTEESQQLVIVSPGARTNIPLVQNRETSKAPPKKRSQSRENSGNEFSRYTKNSGEESETTVSTIGSESQPIQHDLGNSVDSQQNHDHRSGSVGRSH